MERRSVYLYASEVADKKNLVPRLRELGVVAILSIRGGSDDLLEGAYAVNADDDACTYAALAWSVAALPTRRPPLRLTAHYRARWNTIDFASDLLNICYSLVRGPPASAFDDGSGGIEQDSVRLDNFSLLQVLFGVGGATGITLDCIVVVARKHHSVRFALALAHQ